MLVSALLLAASGLEHLRQYIQHVNQAVQTYRYRRVCFLTANVTVKIHFYPLL